MPRAISCILSLALFLSSLTPSVADWPGFRGPNGQATSADRGLPLKWGPTENVVWKVKLPGPGASSPVVSGDRVFVTCYSGYGGAPGGQGDLAKLTRHLVCLDKNNGQIAWQKDVPAKVPDTDWSKMVREHGYATHTPVTDGERVYVFFGRTGVFAYDLTGKELWTKDVGRFFNTFGSGASPILHKNLLIVLASVENSAMVALDKLTGKEVWRVKGLSDCWATPLLVEVPGGGTELVVNGPATMEGYHPDTGAQLWSCDTLTTSYVSSMPLTRNGIVYVMGAGSEGRMFLAVRVGGKGDVTKSHVLWRQKVGASYTSPVLVGEHFYFFSAFAYCLKADTGEVVFQERLPGLGPEYASPVVADGKIYLFTRGRKGFVLASKGKLEVLATNDLGDEHGFIASPAVSGGRLFVRTNAYLYCLGEKGN
jgi:outer membrane protein assembly factor BamB